MVLTIEVNKTRFLALGWGRSEEMLAASEVCPRVGTLWELRAYMHPSGGHLGGARKEGLIQVRPEGGEL